MPGLTFIGPNDMYMVSRGISIWLVIFRLSDPRMEVVTMGCEHLTIGNVSKMTNISERRLRYYDELGLCCPCTGILPPVTGIMAPRRSRS